MEAMSSKFDFRGRRVLLSGGVKGLCDTYAKRFVEHNATVFVLDMDEKSLAELKKTLPAITTIAVDMRSWNTVKAAVEGILPIHHLVCDVAAVGSFKGFFEYEAEDFEGVYDANLTALTVVGQTVARGMIENKIEDGTIVTISSVVRAGCKYCNLYNSELRNGGGGNYSATNHLFGCLLYGSSKAGFENITKFMASELAPFKIRVNCIRPGVCNVAKVRDIQDGFKEGGSVFGRTLERQILGQERISPEEIADAVVALSTTLFPSMTGAVVAVDAGFGCA